jgi:hypothetical protein
VGYDQGVRLACIAVAAWLAVGCGRVGYGASSESSENPTVDAGSTTPPDAGPRADGSTTPRIDAGTGMVSNFLVLKSGEPEWNILSGPDLGGAYATLTYFQSGPTFRFRLDAESLPAGSAYVLVQFNDPWPGTPAEDLVNVTTDDSGTITLGWTEYELNRDLLTGEPKIWLVPAGHMDPDLHVFTQWSPTEYLFEIDFLSYDDTDI